MSLKTVQLALILFGKFFKKSQAHLAQAHLTFSNVSIKWQRTDDYDAIMSIRLTIINCQLTTVCDLYLPENDRQLEVYVE